jgi:hypothetical protein
MEMEVPLYEESDRGLRIDGSVVSFAGSSGSSGSVSVSPAFRELQPSEKSTSRRSLTLGGSRSSCIDGVLRCERKARLA